MDDINDSRKSKCNIVRNKPWFDNFTTGEEEKYAAGKVLDSGYLSLYEGSHNADLPFSFWGGPEVQNLEHNWSKFYGVEYSVAMNSATSCIYAAIGALNIGYGDEIIVSPYTMTACAAGALTYGAIPIFADVDEQTGSLCPTAVEAQITERTKAIILVHQFGIPADLSKFRRLCDKHGLSLIEDCAQAHGAQYNNEFVGKYGDIGIFSLNVNKTIQSGEGGICILNNAELRYRLALIRNHGEAVVGPANYENITNIIGYNYRMTEICAAIANCQLFKLNELNRIRLQLVEKLVKGLETFPFIDLLHHEHKIAKSTYYVCPFRYSGMGISLNRDEFAERMNHEGILFNKGYVKPLYLQPLYQTKNAFKHGYPFTAPENRNSKTNYHKGSCPNAEKMHFHDILINEHVRPPHNESDIDDIISAIDKVYQQHKICH